MDIGALEDHALDLRGVEFAVWAGGHEDLGAVGKKFGGAALIGLDVRIVVADDAVVALAEGGEGEGIGGGPVENEEYLAVGLEHHAQQVARPHGPFIVAIRRQAAAIGFGQGGPGFGTDAGGVVAGEDLIGGRGAIAIRGRGSGGGGHGWIETETPDRG